MSLFQIHSYTTRIARKIDGGTDAMRVDMEAAIKNPNAAPALFSFRALPAYRSEAAQRLRKAVADIVRQERRSCTIRVCSPISHRHHSDTNA